VRPLPTTALPVPGEEKAPTDQPSAKPDRKNTGLELDVSPLTARPMERVNLTGTYEGADGVSLEVQRFEDGGWADFGVAADVRAGTFATYVMTGRVGEQRFRVFDPETRRASNAVVVTIG
jgi:hypothetical protein